MWVRLAELQTVCANCFTAHVLKSTPKRGLQSNVSTWKRGRTSLEMSRRGSDIHKVVSHQGVLKMPKEFYFQYDVKYVCFSCLFGLNQSGSHRETKAFKETCSPTLECLQDHTATYWLSPAQSLALPRQNPPSISPWKRICPVCTGDTEDTMWSNADSCRPCQSLWQLPGHPFPQDSHEAVSLLHSWDKNSLPTCRKQAAPSNF